MIGIEERDAVMRVMDRGILSGYQGNWSDAFYGGQEVKALEKEWAEYFGVKHAIACNSATSGLWMACAAVGLKPERVTNWCDVDYETEQDEVIVTPYSMTCSASIPLHFGAKPVFADIEPDYFCLDPKDVEAKITLRTKAIIVVDLFGQPYAADEINTIAKKHGIMVIEDAAQAAGAKYKGRYAGTLGDIGVYSLNVHKPIQCGEGGVVVTNNEELAWKLRLLMNHAEAVINDMGRERTFTCSGAIRESEGRYGINERVPYASLVGMNLRMTELSAAVAREQLKKLAGIVDKAQEYAQLLDVKVRHGCKHSYYRYAMAQKKTSQLTVVLENSSGVFTLNVDRPIQCNEEFYFKRHYITPLYCMPLFRHLGYPDNLYPVCESVEENIVLAWLKETP